MLYCVLINCNIINVVEGVYWLNIKIIVLKYLVRKVYKKKINYEVDFLCLNIVMGFLRIFNWIKIIKFLSI